MDAGRGGNGNGVHVMRVSVSVYVCVGGETAGGELGEGG